MYCHLKSYSVLWNHETSWNHNILFSISLSVSFCMFPCSKGHFIRAQARIFFISSIRIPERTLRLWKDFRTINFILFFSNRSLTWNFPKKSINWSFLGTTYLELTTYDCLIGRSILAKEQLHHSYTFSAMPILISSPVQITMRHPLPTN